MSSFHAAGFVAILAFHFPWGAALGDDLSQCGSWVPGQSDPTVFGIVHCTCEFDFDGEGGEPPQLVIGGSFNSGPFGGPILSRIARWDGSWKPIGGGLGGDVNTVVSFDSDGDGPLPAQLYAGGDFISGAGSQHSQQMWHLAQWNGTTWEEVGNHSIGGGTNYDVNVMLSFDPDGGGSQSPLLVIGGSFTFVEGTPENRIVGWDGARWHSLGSGFNSTVHALTAHDFDGAGPQLPTLCAGGEFTHAGSTVVNRIATWNGSEWLPLNEGMNWHVLALTSFDEDGPGPDGPRLIAGGAFTTASGVPANRIARWDDWAGWSALGEGTDAEVSALRGYDPDGDGPAPPELIVGGWFVSAGGIEVSHIARWTGGTWLPCGAGMNASVRAIGVTEGPDEIEQIIAVGEFWDAGDANAPRIARWDSSQWHALNDWFCVGLSGQYGTVRTMCTLDIDGAEGPSAARHVVGGNFESVGGINAQNIAEWDGDSWYALGGGLEEGGVHALLPIVVEGGQHLIAGGHFTASEGKTMNRIALWDGVNWNPMGDGFDWAVRELVLFDADGAGPLPVEVVAGGQFSYSGETLVGAVARWDGASWQTFDPDVAGNVYALASFDPDGTGPIGEQLIAGGTIFLPRVGQYVNVVIWDPASGWLPLGGGTDQTVHDLVVYDLDDDGPMNPVLIACGNFSSAGGVPVQYIAWWDGMSWHAFQDNFRPAEFEPARLALIDLTIGSSSRKSLVVGGEVHLGGDRYNGLLFRWSGRSWDAFDGVLDGHFANVNDIERFDVSDGDGVVPSLLVGGSFLTAGDHPSAYWARWLCNQIDCVADLFPADGDGEVGAGDLASLLASWGECPSKCSADIAPTQSPDGAVNAIDLAELLAAWGSCP